MKRYLHLLTITALLFLCSAQQGIGQEFVEKIADFFEFDFGRNRHSEDTTLFVNKVVLAPVMTYEPNTNLGIGVGAKILFKPRGAGPETRTSNIPLSLQYTLNNQFLFYSGYTIFFNEEKYLLKGNLEFSKFPFSYYGVGNTSDESTVIDISFDNFLIEPLLLRRVAPDLFIGGGFRYNTIYNTRLIEDTAELPEGTSLQDELGSTSAGVELAITYDSRDNVLYPLNGNFLEFTHGVYGKVAGGIHEFMLSKLDLRQYFQINPDRLDMLALQWFVRYAWNDAPPLELSDLGGPVLLRGFQEGRFRDRLALFAQAEYRWQALDRIGFVFFAGAGDVSREIGTFSLDNLKYSLGSGIRVKIVKSENLNIRFDYGFGFGPTNANNFYLGISEAF